MFAASNSYLHSSVSQPLCTLPHTPHPQSRHRILLEAPKHSRHKIAVSTVFDWSVRITWGHYSITGHLLPLLLGHISPACSQVSIPVTVAPCCWPQAMIWGLIYLVRQKSPLKSPVFAIPGPFSFSSSSGPPKKKQKIFLKCKRTALEMHHPRWR